MRISGMNLARGAILLFSLVGTACSPASRNADALGNSRGTGQGGGGGSGATFNFGGDSNFLFGTGSATGAGASGSGGPDGSCAAIPFSAEHVVTTTKIPITVTQTQPIDIYIMFDQSLSMTCAIPSGGDRWTAAVTAVQGFVQQQPASAGVNVGIGYFGTSVYSPCDPATYQAPAVEIGPLPPTAPAIVSSLNGHQPVSNTPTAAALSGAINHALPWKVAHPNDVVVVVLVTDGQPNACGTVADVATVAKGGWGNGAGVRTFVVGLTSVGTTCNLDPNPPNVPDLDTVAAAGGTNKSIVIDATADPVKQLTDALNQIRQSITTTQTITKTQIKRSKVPCQYTIPAPPAGQTFDRDKVNIQFTDSAGTKEAVYKVATLADCATTTGYAWYYDPNVSTNVLVCPDTCTKIQAGSSDAGLSPDAAGADPLVDILLGCASQVALR